MKTKRIYDSHDEQGAEQIWAVVLDSGDEVHACLLDFAKVQGLTAAHFTGIGALRSVVLGYFDWQRKEYRRNPVNEQVEVVSLVGDFSCADGKPKLHAHIVVAKADGTALGGHLMEGYVRPTLEVVVTESPAHLRRTMDPESGLALIDLGEEKT